MKKSVRAKKTSDVTTPAPEIADIMNRIQEKLFLMDRKIDTLVSRSGGSPAANRPPESRQDNSYNQRQMHKAVCADCRKQCEVPFRPTGDRPVYCKECFAKRKSAGPFGAKAGSSPGAVAMAQARHFEKPAGAAPRKAAEKKKAVSKKKK